MAKVIELTRGKQTVVDDTDFDRLSRHSWSASDVDNGGGRWYAVRQIPVVGSSQQKKLYMHRVILDAPDNMLVDHINGDGLDNRRSNIRLCTHAENQYNRQAVRGRSQYKGAVPIKEVWRSLITADGVTRLLGTFANDEDAGRAYDRAAIKLHGEFACLNFDDSRHFDFSSWEKGARARLVHAYDRRRASNPPRSSSGFKGVYPTSSGYIARIRHHGETHYLGFFRAAEDAASAYDEAAMAAFGDDVYLNLIRRKAS